MKIEKSDNPLISIGITSYNNSRYIIDTLEGIKSQTYTCFELIIIDDFSTDNSVEIIKFWLASNKQINSKLLVSTENKGVCKSLNLILEECKGDYICLIGSDDIYLPEFLEKRLNFLEKLPRTIGLCYSNTYFIDTTGKRIGIDNRIMPKENEYLFLAKSNQSLCKPFTYLIRKETFEKVGNFDENLFFEDLDWILRVTAISEIKLYDEIDTEYRITPGSLGSKLGSELGVSSQYEIFKKNLYIKKEAHKYFKSKMRQLVVSAYKNNLEISRKLAVSNIQLFFSPIDFFLFFLIFIPIDQLLIIKKKLNFLFSKNER
jgi:glycosyltransferase involved in cell wall biosynthesis